MSLTLLCGPFQPSLEDAFVKRLLQNPPGPSRRVAVVTSSRRLGERLQCLLALERGLSLFNLRFHTLHSLSVDVLLNTGDPLPRVNNGDLFHERLVERLLVEDGWAVERARPLAGAHRATLRDLAEAGVDADSFREHFGDMAIPGEKKLLRLLDLAARYRERLAALGVASSADLARLAAARLEVDGAPLSAYDEFLYYGFYDLNGEQADFFSAVARQGRVTVFFPCLKGHPAYSFAERFLETKLRVGGAAAEFLGEADGALGRAGGRLFHPGADDGKSGHSSPSEKREARPVRVINVSGERDEIWRVAKEIFRLRSGRRPVAWEDVGVVARGLEPYATVLPEVFRENGIPFTMDEGGPLLRDPAARLALDLVDLPLRAHDRDALLAIAASSALADPFRTPSARRFLQAAGPRAGAAWVRDYPERGAQGNSFFPPPLPEALRSLAARCAESPSPARWEVHASRARSLWAELVSPSALTGDAGAALESVLVQLSAFDVFSSPVPWCDFAEAFREAAGRARLPGTGSTRGVRVRGAMEARGDSFRALFLVGLKEGVFPRVIREDPLLSDDLRRLLRDPGGYWILPKLEGYDEEKLLFALLTGSARERLYLLYSRSREDGRAEVPSLYLRELARAAGFSLEEAERVPRPPLEKWEGEKGLTEREAGLSDMLQGRLAPGARTWRETGDRARRLLGRGTPGPYDGLVGRPDAAFRRWADRGLSPSALEKMIECPFRFFMEQVLGVREESDLFKGGALTPLALGRLHHDVLQSVYGGWLEGLPSEEEARARVRAEAACLFDALGVGTAGLHPLVWLAVRRKLESQAEAFVVRDLGRLREEGYRPFRLEWSLRFQPSGFPVAWNGRLDRLDRNAEGRFRVVDYKNKPKKKPLADLVLRGETHQAPVYLELAESALGDGAEGVRYEYLAVNSTEEFSGALWRERRAEIRAAQVALLARIEAGRFLIQPEEGVGGACAFCPYARACRKAHGPTRARSEGEAKP